MAQPTRARVYAMDEGRVSLRELAEEELLLALPVVAACSTPQDLRAGADLRGGRRDSGHVGRSIAAVCRFAGFVKENLIGHSTHGSSEKQKNPF